MTRRTVLNSAVPWLAGILILASGCTDQSPTAVQVDPVAALAPSGKVKMAKAGQAYAAGTYSAVIGAKGGRIDFGAGSIDFPAGAVARNTTISATVNGKDLAVEFDPHGLEFPAGAEPTLTFSYAGVDLPEGTFVAYIDGAGNVLERLPATVDSEAQTVGTFLRHFSGYALASQ